MQQFIIGLLFVAIGGIIATWGGLHVKEGWEKWKHPRNNIEQEVKNELKKGARGHMLSLITLMAPPRDHPNGGALRVFCNPQTLGLCS